MKWKRSIAIMFWAPVLLIGLSSCQPNSQIRSYPVPKEAASAESPVDPSPGGVESRMLVCLVPVKQSVWFLKLTGPKNQIEPHASDFREFLASMQFEENGPSWDLPASWQERPGSGMRYATINVGKPGLDISVISLPAPQEVLSNVNRWRRQLQLAPISEPQLSDEVEEISVAGVNATLVDIVGKLAASPPGTPPFMGSPATPPTPVERQNVAASNPSGPPGDPGFTYETPDGWQPGRLGPMRKLAFVAGQGEEQAEITVTTLGRGGAALLPNVNRWRMQLGLPEISSAELDSATTEIDVGDSAASYVELVGSADRQPRQSTLAVIAWRGNTAWFFKMMGDSSVVADEQPSFESFVKSVKFRVDP